MPSGPSWWRRSSAPARIPDPVTTDWYSLDIEAPDTIEVFRRFERAMIDPPDDLVAALDAFDPARDALVLVMPFDTTTTVAGRPAYGARRPEWVALEDKTTNDALFARAGVACAPSEVVVATDRGALDAAAARLDGGAGTVWSGDARDGFNGGGVLVRRVTGPDRATEVAALMAGRCDRVRVAPFLDGIPCSIHGIVTTDGIAVFRPMEMVVLRTADAGFRYAGVASYWDPPVEARTEMRAAARRVGALLRDEVGFAGSYGIDGVLTSRRLPPHRAQPAHGRRAERRGPRRARHPAVPAPLDRGRGRADRGDGRRSSRRRSPRRPTPGGAAAGGCSSDER